jgi:soluble lytic murein transglycosylase
MTSLLRLSAVAAVLAGGAWSWGLQGGARTSSVSSSPPAAQRSWVEADLWLAPAQDATSPTPLASAVELIAAGQPDRAMPILVSATPHPAVAPYVELHQGRAALALERPGEAAASARRIIAVAPAGYLGESALRLLGESLERSAEWPEATGVWQTLSGLPVTATSPATVQLRLAQAAEKAGDRALARLAYDRVFYEWPASGEAGEAETALARFPVTRGADTVQRELVRATRLYTARRFADAHRTWAQVHARTTGRDRLLVDLRLAQCDVYLQRYTRGLAALASYLERANAPERAEAGYFVLTALRGLRRADYPTRVARFVRDDPASPFAEQALNDLATHYILANDDARAAGIFTDMYARFPQGSFADRAAWRAGWWAYRQDNYRETIRLFESAATTLRRADYRPAWLYWTARSYEALGQRDTARLWYLRAIADYRNSYYGREATRAFQALTGTPPPAAAIAAQRDPARAITGGAAPVNAPLVRQLLSAGLWDDVIGELRRVQAAHGSTPVIEATIAYALNRKGELRPAITAMRRAYPQFMSDGGEQLPERILKVIFPVAHWETIRRHAADRRLDLYLVTALVAQESTFQPDVVSSANAVGMMQLLPSTGRLYARKVGITGFTPAALTDPDTNVRLGTAYLSELLARYGNDPAPALAAYNAGESRVDRWRAERPNLPRDEFIDDIPFPETQNYVKRIIGTAEDYRLLYGATGVPAGAVSR